MRVPPRRRTSYKLLPFVKSGHGRERDKARKTHFPACGDGSGVGRGGLAERRERERGRNIGKDEEGFGGLPSPPPAMIEWISEMSASPRRRRRGSENIQKGGGKRGWNEMGERESGQ